MNTTVLHADVQRSRFTHLLLNAAASLLPTLRRESRRSGRPAAPLGAAEQAALEASHVRQMAYAYSKTDPGFAADLYAAAARHEAESER